MPDDRRYVRVFHADIVRDYPNVWADNDALATWLRLLVVADAMWPTPPELPRTVKSRPLASLVAAGLVIEVPGHRFTIKGLDRDRTERQNAARSAAAQRWHSGRNATASPTPDAGPMPTNATQNQTKADQRTLARDGLPSLTPEAIAALELRTGRPWSMAGDRQLGEFDRLVGEHGLVAVCDAMDAVANGKTGLTARQLVWPAMKLLEPFPVQAPAPIEDGAAERQSIRSKGIQRQMWERRMERYRQTGQWDPEWGDPPKDGAA